MPHKLATALNERSILCRHRNSSWSAAHAACCGTIHWAISKLFVNKPAQAEANKRDQHNSCPHLSNVCDQNILVKLQQLQSDRTISVVERQDLCQYSARQEVLHVDQRLQQELQKPMLQCCCHARQHAKARQGAGGRLQIRCR